MKTVILAILFILGVTGPAWARLGETVDQLTARYGEPLPPPTDKSTSSTGAPKILSFLKGGFRVDVTLSNGTSIAEVFFKKDGDPLTVNEVRTLLSANSQGHDWEAPQTIIGGKRWLRDDNSVANLTDQNRTLIVTSEVLLNEQATAKKIAHEAPTLDGF